ncbi:MAG: carboxypeptidase regulatory-like domain-containing protein, partial [Pseudomonadota bacterium]
FLSSVGGGTVDAGATGVYVGAISSFDLDPLADVPLRLHLNAGMNIDNSGNLAEFTNYSLSSMQVEKFALGINPSRVQIKVGTDFSLRRWVGFGLSPIVEFGIDIATGASDPEIDHPRFVGTGKQLSAEEIEGRMSAWTTFGVRTNPVYGLVADLAMDVGIASPGYGFGPPIVPWNVILGLSYAYNPTPPPPTIKVVKKEVFKPVAKETAPKLGKVRGRIINEITMEPVEGAIVTFPGQDLTGLSSDPDGSFLSYGFPAGELRIMVRHPDYLPGNAIAKIGVGTESKVEVKLAPAPSKAGRIVGTVVDPTGNPVTATVNVSGAEDKQVQTDGNGSFSLELMPGEYSVSAVAEGYLGTQQQVVVTLGSISKPRFILSTKTEGVSSVKITRRSITLTRKVHFATGTVRLMPDSLQLLDEVANVLNQHQEIRLVEIGGHTDSFGGKRRNLWLSRGRAKSVRSYLIEKGVSANRLKARGYGPYRPLVPNITPRNRDRNRRVEFKIVKRQKRLRRR